MDLSIKDSEFLDSFDHLQSHNLDEHHKNKLELFILKINSNEFDYDGLIRNLVDPLIDFSLSRKVKEQYQNKPATLSRKAREKFRDYLQNKGELGELLLYCFLECHLNAPKLLSKLELKTATNNYVNGADGVHFLRLPSGHYQLIFGEAKTVSNLTSAITDAFQSIYEFKNCITKNDKEKSGLPYEKSLISDHLEKEAFSIEDKNFITQIIYPKKDTHFEVDDAFGVFVGYEVKINSADKLMRNSEFREKIKAQIATEVEASFAHIKKKVIDFNLSGHCFHIYIVPFSNLDSKRAYIQEAITK